MVSWIYLDSFVYFFLLVKDVVLHVYVVTL